jgi:hypothetical protein
VTAASTGKLPASGVVGCVDPILGRDAWLAVVPVRIQISGASPSGLTPLLSSSAEENNLSHQASLPGGGREGRPVCVDASAMSFVSDREPGSECVDGRHRPERTAVSRCSIS